MDNFCPRLNFSRSKILENTKKKKKNRKEAAASSGSGSGLKKSGDPDLFVQVGPPSSTPRLRLHTANWSASFQLRLLTVKSSFQ